MKLGIDLLKHLEDIKGANNAINEAKAILNAEVLLAEREQNQFKTAEGLGEIDEGLLNEKRCYTINQIKELALRYRLRFLPIKYFKNIVPTEAFNKINHLKKLTGNQEIENSLYILAPEEMFRLSDINSDPILFAATSSGRYYYIHKWGGELNPVRALYGRVLRNERWTITSILLLGILFGMLLPEFIFKNSAVQLGASSLFLFKSFYGIFVCSAVFSYWFFLRCSGLNNRIWNSKHFNF
ncbi:hypothetical protein [Luteibaculum oceani]|uniref:Uncharacterized protein n=1 Tax=Luteibaculum oceani TaxID=1294296 RepID=A0A5C6V1Q2_9FLAO|nr:hypothetical protein [Luteibaculum oceani]TXC78611.1 hypothetical protein FRX97_07800 [Luteibaculum oceani]